jgi:hypothetical protein
MDGACGITMGLGALLEGSLEFTSRGRVCRAGSEMGGPQCGRLPSASLNLRSAGCESITVG